jgi:hypothetical protein
MPVGSEKVLVVGRIPGIGAIRVRQSGDRNYAALAVRGRADRRAARLP